MKGVQKMTLPLWVHVGDDFYIGLLFLVGMGRWISNSWPKSVVPIHDAVTPSNQGITLALLHYCWTPRPSWASGNDVRMKSRRYGVGSTPDAGPGNLVEVDSNGFLARGPKGPTTTTPVSEANSPNAISPTVSNTIAPGRSDPRSLFIRRHRMRNAVCSKRDDGTAPLMTRLVSAPQRAAH
jgi:hypothetical protein